MSSRPRPKARLAIDVDNPYARLKVSPLANLDEIKRAAADRRAQWMHKRKTEGPAGWAECEARMIEIQEIEKQIGARAARVAYDREHPQNTLLTVQAGPRDRSFAPSGVAALVTAWLAEELGPDVRLLHPDALWLWLPVGLDPALAEELAHFQLEPADPPPDVANSLQEDSWRTTTK